MARTPLEELGLPDPLGRLILNLFETVSPVQSSAPVRNVEKVSWTDWQGEERTIEIHREVE